MKVYEFGRFEKSFSFHMIRDFFLLLLLVTCAELGIQYAAMVYKFQTTEQSRIDASAQGLADDIKAIMLNSGGPTAAQTIYPILRRNYEDVGLSIAVLPSDLTVKSIEQTFRFTPIGLQPNWMAGEHIEAVTSLKSEEACLGCHIKAKVGDVLGTITVRSYLEPKESAWWTQVSVMAGTMSIKIIFHTILLFLLLRARMEPMMSLRATTAALAKGVMDLSPRAKVNSADEFGELAADLNSFLDRVKLLVHDLDQILSEVMSVGDRLGTLSRGLEQQLDEMRESSSHADSEGAQRSVANQIVAAREAGAFEVLMNTLDEVIAAKFTNSADAEQLRGNLLRLKKSFLTVTEAVSSSTPTPEAAPSEVSQFLVISQSLREMTVLEGSMQKVAESGQRLIDRLQGSKSVLRP
ncbi:MAG: HAMP domain-containing protein [Proteobacteria bacterium]|nr:HAMP domain-containing protein [Pseudomonadota bacterium]